MKKTCDTCGGTGQIQHFQGVSRFLLTTEECPACSGFGYALSEEEKPKDKRGSKTPKSKKKSTADNDHY